jgi:molybdate transport system substrate-binding protein
MNWLLGNLLVFLCLLLVGCEPKTQSSVSTTEATEATLTISAAASLKDSMEDIKQLYSKEKPKVTLIYNFGASGALQQQIEQGAPVDIFISAASKQMDSLQEKGLLINDTRKNLLTNKVVLIVPKNAIAISGFKNLADANVKKVALAEPASVPAGKYAQEVLTSFGIFDKVKPKTVFGKDVRQVLNYVETGNVDAGIVYETDAKVSNKVRVVAIAANNLHSPIVYPVAVLKRSQNSAVASEFIQFLDGNQSKAVFEKYGFKFRS